MAFESQAIPEKGMASLAVSTLPGSSSPSEMIESGCDTPKGAFSTLMVNILLVWEFTESNFPTFVIPNTAFGILGALAGSRLADGPAPGIWAVAARLPLVVAFNWYNVLIFDLANQRLPESVTEDEINKPWRPIPTKKITSEQTRTAMLFAIPAVVFLNHAQGVFVEGLCIQILTWLYNDLKGGDGVFRDTIISVAYSLFNGGSLKIALGSATVSSEGQLWTYIISGVILTTMQVQDLKDQEGDRTRGRQTIPLLFGEQASRLSIALFTVTWSIICAIFWGLPHLVSGLPMAIGAFVAYRVMAKRTSQEDANNWKLWCLWTMTLYCLPLTAPLTAR